MLCADAAHELTREKPMTSSAKTGPAGFGDDAPAMVDKVRRAMTLHQQGDFASASALYREVLAKHPAHPDVIHYLGMAVYKLGHKEQARELFSRSIQLDGRRSVVHVNLGRTYLNDGEYDTALRHFVRAVELDPNDWEALHMLGRAQLATDRPFEAAISLERAAARRPNLPSVLLDLAHAYGSCKRHPAAVETFRKLLELEPDNVEALGGLAFSLRPMNRANEALASLEKATQLAPKELRWLCELGGLEEELGDFDAAVAIFRSALEQKPKYPTAVAHLLALRKGLEDPSLVVKAEEHLAARDIVKPVRVQLEFALGKHFDAAKDFDGAFRHYAAANDIVAEGRKYKPLAVEAHVSRLISTFDRALFEAKRALGSESERPLFVIGMPRSGTTLTEQILASHREIAGAGELGYFNYMAYTLSREAGLEGDLATYAPSLDGTALKRCFTGYLEQLDEVSADAARVVDKMPMNFMQLGLIALAFPRARVIHCRRDPLDTCLSCYFENFHEDQRYSTKLESLGHYYRQYERLMQHWARALPLPILEMRYEDTVADTEAQARRLIEFCGLEWDESCLDFHRTSRAVNTPSRWQVRQPIYSSSVERWRRYEKHLGPLREALAR
jgi:Flp pilus assembly protein TadD